MKYKTNKTDTPLSRHVIEQKNNKNNKNPVHVVFFLFHFSRVDFTTRICVHLVI